LYNGGAGRNFWEQNFDLLELAKKFTELKFSLESITMILNGQVEKKDDLIL
jgi:DNA-binding transcriptional MerR regulator